MKRLSGRQWSLVVAAGVVALTAVYSWIQLHYEYSYLKQGPAHNPFAAAVAKITGRTAQVRVAPTGPLVIGRFLRSDLHMRAFGIYLHGASIGFEKETSVEMSTSAGGICQIQCPELIKPRFPDGSSAVSWQDLRFRKKERTVFIDGPYPDGIATIVVTLLSDKEELPKHCLSVIVAGPTTGSVSVAWMKELKLPDTAKSKAKQKTPKR